MITTRQGHTINFLNPDLNAIDIRDIAHALGRECRWGNHTRTFYSVAEHSIQLSYLSEYPKEALLHDATEAYMRDLPAPLKDLIPEYKRYEDHLQEVIFKKFGLEEIPDEVHQWDREYRDFEWEHFFKGNSPSLTPEQAKYMFLERFYELWNT